MGSKKRRSKIYSRNQSNIEEIRDKDRERRKKRAILRGEEVANQPMMRESKANANNIDHNLKVIQFHIHIYDFIFLVI